MCACGEREFLSVNTHSFFAENTSVFAKLISNIPFVVIGSDSLIIIDFFLFPQHVKIMIQDKNHEYAKTKPFLLLCSHATSPLSFPASIICINMYYTSKNYIHIYIYILYMYIYIYYVRIYIHTQTHTHAHTHAFTHTQTITMIHAAQHT